MARQKSLTSGVVLILMLFLVAGPAAAKRPDRAPDNGPGFLLRTPEARVQGWQDGLLKFLAEHRDLTSEQTYAVQNLADIDNPAAFSLTLEPNKRDLFAKRLDELGRVLSYSDYLGMLRSFDDELRVWLVRNGLALQAQAATDACNCSAGGGCANGYACENVTCLHEGGTTHSGRCGAATLVE